MGRNQVEYELLKVLPFDSNRKCMSIVVRQTGSQNIILYTKGADNSIMAALTPYQGDPDEGELREKTQQHLDSYARQGLRVLVMAKRHLDPHEFTEWWNKHQEIEMSMENREKRIRDSYSTLESNLTLLGATGIEDRLQEGVPETIVSLRKAGTYNTCQNYYFYLVIYHLFVYSSIYRYCYLGINWRQTRNSNQCCLFC